MPEMMKQAFSGTSNATISIPDSATSLFIANDGGADLTFTAGSITFVLRSGEKFDERVIPFTKLTIVATGAYRGYVRNDE